jgi:hypothetical protein
MDCARRKDMNAFEEKTNQDALLVLIAARWLISDPSCWTTGAYARDNAGFLKMPVNPVACSWCAYGAMQAAFLMQHERVTEQNFFKVWPYLDRTSEAKAIQALSDAMHPSLLLVTSFNDTHSHTEVLSAFDKAIATLCAEIDT